MVHAKRWYFRMGGGRHCPAYHDSASFCTHDESSEAQRTAEIAYDTHARFSSRSISDLPFSRLCHLCNFICALILCCRLGLQNFTTPDAPLWWPPRDGDLDVARDEAWLGVAVLFHSHVSFLTLQHQTTLVRPTLSTTPVQLTVDQSPRHPFSSIGLAIVLQQAGVPCWTFWQKSSVMSLVISLPEKEVLA